MDDSAMDTSIHSVTRKRPRPTTPTKRSSLDLAAPASNDISKDDTRAESLRNPETRNAELNELLQLSANHEINFSMQSDAILRALVDIILVDCLNWNPPPSSSSGDHETEPFIFFRSKNAWKEPPTKAMANYSAHCCSSIEGLEQDEGDCLRTMEAVAVILRNFSFTGANLRLLAYSPKILQVLMTFMYIGSRRGSETIPLMALQTLLHLVRYLDVTGQQILCDKLFYDGSHGPAVPDTKTFNRAVQWGGMGACWLAKRLDTREDVVENLPTEFVLELCADYMVAVWSIFPALAAVLMDVKAPRPVVLMALDLLQEFIGAARVGLVGPVDKEPDMVKPGQDYDIPKLRAILVNIPDAVLERLTDLLYVPKLGSDSLDYVDPVYNIVTRVTTLKLLMGYDATVDTDARDRALDVLVPLLELDSPRMAARLGRDADGNVRARLYDALIPILTTSVGRNEASVLASQLFRELARAEEENKIGLEYVKSRLVELASRDPRVSALVWNDLYPLPREEESSGEESEDDDGPGGESGD